MDASSDDDLVAAVARGDEASCRLLMERHLPRMVALARRMLGNQADAEDVAQEVFLRVWTHAERWQPGRAQFGTWLHRVATNLCLDRLRASCDRTSTTFPNPPAAIRALDENLERRELAERVEAALQALPERQRTAIVLSHYQGLTNIEAAEILEISVEAVESLLGAPGGQLRAGAGDGKSDRAAAFKRTKRPKRLKA